MTRARSVLPLVAVIAIAGLAIAGLAVIAVRPIIGPASPPATASHETAAGGSGGSGGPLAAVSGQLRGLKTAMTAVPRSLAEVVSLLRQLVIALTYTHCSGGATVPPGQEC